VSKLFSPIKIRNLEIKNRIWISPMCMYSCEQKDGVVNDFHLVHLTSRAVGGAGLTIVEATAVEPEGRITPWCTGIWNDDQISAWKKITDSIRSNGSKSAIQLAHAGRKASTYRAWSGTGSVPLSEGGWQTVSSTTEAFEGYESPRELTESEVEGIVDKFVEAAKRSVAAGFDAIEIHAAHGYLIHQFLSPITNKRSDKYGGSLENRSRLLLEIVEGVRNAIGPNMPLMVRFSGTDYKEGGWDPEQTAQVAKWASELGADLFDISSGGLITGVKIPSGPGYQVPLAEQIEEIHPDGSYASVGQITDPHQAEAILQEGKVDVILIGRASLRDPYWPLRAAHALGDDVSWPKQYLRGMWPKG
jgi:2,4-dienoyl-CoA reductase-like NADH-dependent reductase (Old Yellow Enzyme family)